eukprot:TRINITY_DN41497_c0_g1_i1.p1 TRINITY_DN41497_c0_g1~~TRINITY_DN41497_c0_g1_i1.p1  ORF type:complete len:803 (+),score=149.79 TRINITY_DN41497_c0_g1_i1:78-2411(+)
MPAPIRHQPPVFDERGTAGALRQLRGNNFEAEVRDEPTMAAERPMSVPGSISSGASRAVSTSPRIRYGNKVLNQVNEFRHNGQRKYNTARTPRSLEALEHTHQVAGACLDLVCVDNLKILRHLLSEDVRQLLAGHMQELLKELREDLKGESHHHAGGQQCSDASEIQKFKNDFLNVTSELRLSVIQEIRKIAKARETSMFLLEEPQEMQPRPTLASAPALSARDDPAIKDLVAASDSKFAEVVEEIKVFRNMLVESEVKLKKTVEDRTKESAAQLAKAFDSLEHGSQTRCQELMVANTAKWTETFCPAMLALRTEIDALRHEVETAHGRIEAMRVETETSRSDLASLRTATLESHANLQRTVEGQTNHLQRTVESHITILGENSNSNTQAHSRALEELARSNDDRWKEVFRDREADKTYLSGLMEAMRGELEALRTKALGTTLDAIQEGQARLKHLLEERTHALDENAALHAKAHAKALAEFVRSSDDRWRESIKEKQDMQARALKDKEDLMTSSSSKWTEMFIPEMGSFRKEMGTLHSEVEIWRATMLEGQTALNDALEKKTNVLSETITCHAKTHAEALESLAHKSDDRWREIASDNEAAIAKAAKQNDELMAANDAHWRDVFRPEIGALRTRILEGQAELKDIVTPPPLVSGMLRVIVKSARNLTNMDSGLFGNVSDPYVLVQVGRQEVATPVVNNNLNPVWHDKNNFELAVGTEVKLALLVWNKNKSKQDHFLGFTTLDFRFLTPNITHEKSEPLINGQAGELEYSVCFTPDR